MTTPNGDTPDRNNDLDDELNQWIAAGHALLRRLQERRQRYLSAAQDLKMIEDRTQQAIHELRTLKEATA